LCNQEHLKLVKNFSPRVAKKLNLNPLGKKGEGVKETQKETQKKETKKGVGVFYTLDQSGCLHFGQTPQDAQKKAAETNHQMR